MANRRLTMNKMREVLRYHELKLFQREIARALKVSRPTVSEYIERFKKSGLTYKEIEEMKDSELLETLNCHSPKKIKQVYEELAKNFPSFKKELSEIGVTKQLLWREYIAEHPDGYQYSQFCHHYQKWLKSTELSMHQDHKAGDKAFIDFTGKKFKILDFKTGQEREVETFLATLGASGYTYVEALESQQKHDWIQGNENAIRFFGGSPAALVPDCLKSAVTKADKYEPDINPEYADFARHYNTSIVPARSLSPKDKALVENAVNLVYKWIYAPLRNRTFFSLQELNAAIKEKLVEYNERVMQVMQISRKQLFEQIDKPALRELPAERFSVKTYKKIKASKNYHVYFQDDGHYYSVPYRYRGQEVILIATERVVEIFLDNAVIARHRRNKTRGGYTTEPEHMPTKHRTYAERSPENTLKNAEKLGESVKALCSRILNSEQHLEQSSRICAGILSLQKQYSSQRINNACKRALDFGINSFKRVKNMLEQNMDKIPISENENDTELAKTSPQHENLRGPHSYRRHV